MATFPMSAGYVELVRKGLEVVVYACDHGRERSCAAMYAAQDRGEKASIIPNGFWGLYKQANYVLVDVVLLIKKNYGSNKHLRLIIDGPSHPQGLLECFEQSGVSFEVVCSSQLRLEAEACGQDWDEYI